MTIPPPPALEANGIRQARAREDHSYRTSAQQAQVWSSKRTQHGVYRLGT